jgi:hypothetical protein
VADFSPQATPDEVRRTLGPIIAKPELKDKHLAKPPFLFVHDVFTNVTKATGFGKGLFADLVAGGPSGSSDDWLDGTSDVFKVKGADGKSLHRPTYLARVISCVALANNARINVSVANILAGKESQQTQALLISLAQAATENLAWSANAVKRVHAGEDQATVTDTSSADHHSALAEDHHDGIMMQAFADEAASRIQRESQAELAENTAHHFFGLNQAADP